MYVMICTHHFLLQIFFPLSSIYSPYVITSLLHLISLYITHYYDLYPRMTLSYLYHHLYP